MPLVLLLLMLLLLFFVLKLHVMLNRLNSTPKPEKLRCILSFLGAFFEAKL
jgi:hypothetical protein